MAAKGTESKEKVMQNILAAFPGAFKYDKEIRIPMVENGEPLQIKVTLTAAKNMVAAGGDTAIPGAQTKEVVVGLSATGSVTKRVPVEPTDEEKKNVSNLLNMLGL